MSQNEMLKAEPPAGGEGNRTSLKQQLHQAQARYQKRSLLLIAPLFLFILVSFLFPILSILGKSVSNPDLRVSMPTTIEAMRQWSGKNVPDESVFRALVSDLRNARSTGQVATITKRLG